MNFHIYRNILPHWRQENATYFVTFRLFEFEQPLCPGEQTVVRDALLFFDRKRYELAAWVVMDDHAHALVWPQEEWDLEHILHSWKSFTANQLQRRFARQGIIWQKESFDRIVRDEKEWLEKQRYIMNNPFKRWPELSRYEWVWPVEQLGPEPQ